MENSLDPSDHVTTYTYCVECRGERRLYELDGTVEGLNRFVLTEHKLWCKAGQRPT